MAAINANVVSSAVRSNCSTRVETQDLCIWCFFNVRYFNEVFFREQKKMLLVHENYRLNRPYVQKSSICFHPALYSVRQKNLMIFKLK